MIGVYLLIVCMVVVLLGAFTFLGLELMRSFFPYTVFKIHVFFTKKGFYRVERQENKFKIKTPFLAKVRFEVYSSSWRSHLTEEDKKYLTIQGDYTISNTFSFHYHTERKMIESFDCEEKFAKQMDYEEFVYLLNEYIPFVLEREHGKKTDQQKAKEAMKNQKLSPVKPKKSASPIANEAINPLNIESEEIRYLIAQINQKSSELKPYILELSVEEKHAFEQLVQNRLPKLIHQYRNFDTDKQHEKQSETKQILLQSLSKLNQLIEVAHSGKEIDYEKQMIIIKELIK